ncbi:RagB/SusD family nutrient uptake outer membrane protein [Reichenbachiella agarivorans]|uniref:RagB/SusD family nutrient uptake outer membrane protein n=1 Tax=Reichenbachiella agarivorans TaxID=2979464 RepID=A0ABY6CRF5_9BACT|nr:RagB/SusD family nutrient uptake outer membrane protein [Reichenbachiella agarivorans]UXP33092.1 RagB/SusD family nutrient uptake outer membrane protein [Reichenbachiella agarivorans]
MKKSYIISAMFAIVMVFGMSCEDLEERPTSVLAPEGLFNTPTDLQSGVNGAYSFLCDENFYGRKLSLALLVRGDMCGIGDPSTAAYRQECDKMAMSVNNNAFVDISWPMGYKILAAVNQVINAKDLVSGSQEEIDGVVGQAYFIRAHIHYVMVRLYGKFIYMDGSNILNPYDEVESEVDDIYAGIISDLELAAAGLPDVPVDRFHPGKAAAYGMLASVYLTRGEWQKAYDNAKEVIDNAGKYNVGLEADYYDLFDPAVSSNEILWELRFNANDSYEKVDGSLGGSNSGTDQVTSITGPRGDERFKALHTDAFGWSALVPELSVYSTWNGKDYRKAVSLDTAITYQGAENYSYTNWGTISQNVARPHIAKYFRATGESGLRNGVNTGPSLRDSNTKQIILRYAEVLLIAAEAAVELGDNASAVTYVNMVRARARAAAGAGDAKYPPSAVPADISGTVTWEDVVEERRLELAFEGGRWYDIVRRKMGNVFSGAAPALENRTFNPAKDYLFPKYQVDVTLLKGLNQNPGYN